MRKYQDVLRQWLESGEHTVPRRHDHKYKYTASEQGLFLLPAVSGSVVGGRYE